MGKPEGVIAIASAISDMRALSSLNLASNNIGGYTSFNGFHATPKGKHAFLYIYYVNTL
jgi:hypothetical protein